VFSRRLRGVRDGAAERERKAGSIVGNHRGEVAASLPVSSLANAARQSGCRALPAEREARRRLPSLSRLRLKRVLITAMEERARRIVESAVELAEKGGFEAVRLRDVAAHADVALGTLYRRFRSKEDLLIAALDLEIADQQQRLRRRPPDGPTRLERVTTFFEGATRSLCRRPNLARAMIRAVATGDHELTQKMAAFHDRVNDLVLLSLRGKTARDTGAPESAEDYAIARSLQMLWFASLVGWSGGVHGQSAIIEQTRAAAELMLRDAKD
jgi:AcrR family transcriptional regulator